jgi:hypothetical protein
MQRRAVGSPASGMAVAQATVQSRWSRGGMTDTDANGWPPYYRPRPPVQVGLILGAVFVAVGIAVVVVYQQGHDKPMMTPQMMAPPQPQPAALAAFAAGLGTCPGHAAQACPGAGGAGCPTGGGGGACPGGAGGPGAGGAAGQPVQPVASETTAPTARPSTAQPAVCPRCGGLAVPLCDRCNAVMLPLSAGLFSCGRCGAVGTPPCPYCGARMTTGTLTPTVPAPPGARWR